MAGLVCRVPVTPGPRCRWSSAFRKLGSVISRSPDHSRIVVAVFTKKRLALMLGGGGCGRVRLAVLGQRGGKSASLGLKTRCGKEVSMVRTEMLIVIELL